MKIGVLLKKKTKQQQNMEIVRRQNSFSEVQSTVHEKMDT